MTGKRYRIGIDLGGTKIAGCVLNGVGSIVAQHTVAAPRLDYSATINALADLISTLETMAAARAVIGIGMPGSISPVTGLVQNANSVWLNGRPLNRDLEAVLGRSVRFANDANCFALSEATDGAAAGAASMFGVILGTGCGGGCVIGGQTVNGPRGIGGEWGHNPLPWPTPEELTAPPCWCSRTGCMETWVSGPGMAADHARSTGQELEPEAIVSLAQDGDLGARTTLERHAHRLARGLATITNLFDPHVIVLGGGLSALPHLYETLPGLMEPYIFADSPMVDVRPPRWGPTSGMRGAAWLWALTDV
jgi:fructokinase